MRFIAQRERYSGPPASLVVHSTPASRSMSHTINNQPAHCATNNILPRSRWLLSMLPSDGVNRPGSRRRRHDSCRSVPVMPRQTRLNNTGTSSCDSGLTPIGPGGGMPPFASALCVAVVATVSMPLAVMTAVAVVVVDLGSWSRSWTPLFVVVVSSSWSVSIFFVDFHAASAIRRLVMLVCDVDSAGVPCRAVLWTSDAQVGVGW